MQLQDDQLRLLPKISIIAHYLSLRASNTSWNWAILWLFTTIKSRNLAQTICTLISTSYCICSLLHICAIHIKMMALTAEEGRLGGLVLFCHQDGSFSRVGRFLWCKKGITNRDGQSLYSRFPDNDYEYRKLVWEMWRWSIKGYYNLILLTSLHTKLYIMPFQLF